MGRHIILSNETLKIYEQIKKDGYNSIDLTPEQALDITELVERDARLGEQKRAAQKKYYEKNKKKCIEGVKKSQASSEKRKASKERYRKSAKGKLVEKKSKDKYLASDKGKAMMRRYYEKHPERLENVNNYFKTTTGRLKKGTALYKLSQNTDSGDWLN